MTNIILNDTRELTIDELEMVSGGSWMSAGQDFTAGLTLGLLGVSMVNSVVHVAANAARAEKQING